MHRNVRAAPKVVAFSHSYFCIEISELRQKVGALSHSYRYLSSEATSAVGDIMSEEVAYKMYQRDRQRAQMLFKHSPTLSKSASLEGDHFLHRFEPDWSKFEHVYAHGKKMSNVPKSILPLHPFPLLCRGDVSYETPRFNPVLRFLL